MRRARRGRGLTRQLLTYGTTEYAWNTFGQLQSKTDTATGETTSYEYDLYGNLLSVALPDGRTIEYEVDGAGRRVGRRVLSETGVELEYRGWIYRDLLRPIAEVDSAGNVVARYVYDDGAGSRQNGAHQLATRLGANQDTSLPFAGENVPDFIETVGAGGTVTARLRLIKNQVGTVLAAVDATTGAVEQRIEYDEFGRVLFDSAPGMQPFGFAGGLYDAETGLVRFGARDYEPTTGRWTARDPVGLRGQQLNYYAYINGDPVSESDANGLFWDSGSWAEYTGGGMAGFGAICLGIGGAFTPVGWGLIAGGIVVGGIGYAISGDDVADNMSTADENLEPVRDRREREDDQWDQYNQLMGNDDDEDEDDD